MTAPGVGDRAAFFATWDQPIVKVVIPMAQSDTWTSDFYPCKKSGVAGARLDRQETYDRLFLAWHWRLGAEQLLFSHQNRDASNRPLFMSNVKPMLLACGVEDRVPWNDICPATQNTAQQMSATPGKALFLGQTGHSVDGERHSFFAREVVQFLGLGAMRTKTVKAVSRCECRTGTVSQFSVTPTSASAARSFASAYFLRLSTVSRGASVSRAMVSASNPEDQSASTSRC